MSKFFKLLKVDIINSFQLNQLRNSKSKKAKTKPSGLGGVVVFLLFLLVFFSIYAVTIGVIGKMGDTPELVLAFGISLGTIMTLMLSLMNAYGILFKSKDFDLLMSLPLQPKTIVASKLGTMTLLGYAYFSFAYLPSIIVYQVIAGFDAVVLLLSIVVLICGPLLVMTICSILSYVIGIITSKMKHKNILSSLLYVLFIVVVFIVSFTVGTMTPTEEGHEADVQYALEMYGMFAKMYPLTDMIINGMLGKVTDLLLFMGISIVPFVLFIYIISMKYVSINSRNVQGYKNKNFKLKEEKQQGQMKTLLKRELKTIFNTPIYLSNTIIGPIMSAIVLIGGAYACGFKAEEVFGDDQTILNFIPALLAAASAFTLGMAPSTSVSINMEGKQFWIIKSLPIDSKKIIWSKILFYLILCAPTNIIGGIIAIIFMKLSIFDSICILITPFLFAFSYAAVGLLFNMKFYNLDWDNPTQAVKQGAGLLLTMLIDFVMNIFLIVPIIVLLVLEISAMWWLLVYGIFLAFLMYLIISKKGVKSFDKIA